MNLGFIIYGSLNTLSGGYLYDRKLIEYLRLQGDRVQIISLPWRNYAAHLLDNLSFRLPEMVNSQKLDVLIQDELNHPSLLLANRGRHPYPVISLVHHLRCSEKRPEWQNAFYSLIEKQYLQSVDGFIFNSETTQNIVNNLLDRRKPGIVGYPPTDRFGAPLSEEEIVDRAKTSPLKILFLGNVIYRKGLHTLLEAVKRLNSPIRIDVVGALNVEPAYASKIVRSIEDNHLASGVFLHGSLDKQPLIERLRDAHLLVVPSSYEGFGIVYLEGMCFGLPAIGTTAGAAGEIIEHGQTGYLIAPDHAQSLAVHLTSLAKDRELLIHLSLNARARYLRQPSWEETARKIRAFLEMMVQDFAPHRRWAFNKHDSQKG